MEPGRELDKLVAEAMGLSVYSFDADGYHPYQGKHDWLNNRDNYPHITNDKDRLTIWAAPDTDGKEWAPSTDWAAAGAAWEWLIKKEADHHGWFRLGMDNGIPSVLIIVCRTEDWEEVVVARGETFQHAIALAVVEAAKVKETLT